MVKSLLLLILGLVCVIKGADFLINGASSLAKRLKIPEIVIGLTIVAFGTSAPELVVNIFAGIAEKNELSFGNILGSNVFNGFFILGVAALIYPLEVKRNTVRKEIPFSILVTLLLFVLTNDSLIFNSTVNILSRVDGLILLVFFGIFLYYTFGLTKSTSNENGDLKLYSTTKTWILILIGFAGLFLGGKLVVDHAVIIARNLQVSDKLIGLTIVSIGTSLPELATSAIAAYKKRCDIAVGNVVGSNIFNILFILGVSAEISPIKYNVVLNVDLVLCGLASIFLFIAMFTLKKGKLDRLEAFFFLTIYVTYLVYIISRK